MTHAEALQAAIDQLESDAEATEDEDDATYLITVTEVLHDILRCTA